MIARGALLAAVLWLTACAGSAPPPPRDPAWTALNVGPIAVGPVAYAVRQPDESCALYLDEELRSAVVRELRQRGYEATAVGDSVPRTFAAGTAPPSPGVLPTEVAVTPVAAEALLQVWIDEYWANTLCGWEGPKYLTMGAEAVLYAGSPLREVWRSRARAIEQGGDSASHLIWVTTSRLTDGLLATLPAGPHWSGRN